MLARTRAPERCPGVLRCSPCCAQLKARIVLYQVHSAQGHVHARVLHLMRLGQAESPAPEGGMACGRGGLHLVELAKPCECTWSSGGLSLHFDCGFRRHQGSVVRAGSTVRVRSVGMPGSRVPSVRPGSRVPSVSAASSAAVPRPLRPACVVPCTPGRQGHCWTRSICLNPVPRREECHPALGVQVSPHATL